MNQRNLSKYREAFNDAVDLAIRECSRQTGKTDIATVYAHLKKTAKLLLRRLRIILADRQVRVIIHNRLKRAAISCQHGQQLRLDFDFFSLEPFRVLRDYRRISYPSENRVEFTEYPVSLEWQREASIRHLDQGIAADIARRNSEVAANDWLHPLVVQYGDRPAVELVSLWLEAQKAEHGR